MGNDADGRVSLRHLLGEVGAVGPAYVAVQLVAGLAPAALILLIANAVGPHPMALGALGIWLAAILVVSTITDAVSTGLRAQVLDRSRIALEHHWIEQVARWPDLGVFEDPRLVRARTEAERAVPELGNAVVFLGFIALSVASLAPVAGAALRLNPLLTAAVVVGGLPLAVGTTRLYRRAWDARSLRLPTVLRADGLKEAATDLRSAKDLRAYSMEAWVVGRWLHFQRGLVQEVGAVRQQATVRVVAWAVGGALVVVVTLFLTLPAATTPQELAILIGLLLQVSSSLGLLIQASADIGEMRRPLRRYLGFVNGESGERPGGVVTGAGDGIGMEGVTFAYGDDGGPVLQDVSVRFVAAELNLVVGPNGAGKSTFIKLLTGLYAPQSGVVRCGRHGDLSVMHQEFARFSLSVRENLAVGRTVPNDDVWRALERVGLREVVEQLPNGLDTPLYRDGTDHATDLSGGQWQRLALARLLLDARSSSIVLLDEPTSALDALGEADMLDVILDELRGKTVVLVTHRLQWALTAKSVVQIGDGHAEASTHAALLRRSDWYRDAFERQSSAFARPAEPPF